jgi:DNA polymerase-3 subunit delta
MKFAELKGALKLELAPVYCLHGTDVYLINKAVELIKSAAGADGLNTSRLDDTASASDIITECRTVSFMGGKRIVIVRPFVQDLSAYLKSPSKDTVLIVVSAGEIKNTESVDCNPMPPDLLIKLIANQLNQCGKKITPAAANLLCNYCGNLYSRIDGELNKLVNFFAESESLDVNEINQIVTKTQEYQIYELSNAVCGGNIGKAEEILRTLQDQGVEDYAIFGNLVSALRRVYYSLSCKAPNNEVAAVLGCSPYAVNYARRDYKHLTTKISALYSYALNLEYEIKSGKVSVYNAVVVLLGHCIA